MPSPALSPLKFLCMSPSTPTSASWLTLSSPSLLFRTSCYFIFYGLSSLFLTSGPQNLGVHSIFWSTDCRLLLPLVSNPISEGITPRPVSPSGLFTQRSLQLLGFLAVPPFSFSLSVQIPRFTPLQNLAVLLGVSSTMPSGQSPTSFAKYQEDEALGSTGIRRKIFSSS